MSDLPGPEVVKVVTWKQHEVRIGDGTGRPPQMMVGGPKVMLVQCTKCGTAPWRVTEGRHASESTFEAAGMMVSVYCASCEQLRGQQVSNLPGYVETHAR